MHFFRSREDAEGWSADRKDVLVLSLAEGNELVQSSLNWVRRGNSTA